MIKIHDTIITPTIFPDKTSQVWKLSDELVKKIKSSDTTIITWEFENEAELFHLAQLNALLREYFSRDTILVIPYLPYGRQDKDIANDTTFALNIFAKMINDMNFKAVETIDAHSYMANLIYNLIDWSAKGFFNPSMDIVLCYPDKGAAKRYTEQFLDNDYIILEKKRNQLTGEIEGLQFLETTRSYYNDGDEIICIVDDICDGGRTFIEAAKLLKTLKPKEIHLYVSHGIFSKGIQPLLDAGISKIFTHKGEVDIKGYYTNVIEER